MITKIKINNCYTFNRPVELNLKADMRTKRFFCNVYETDSINIMKTAIIYGPNNTGKTAIISSLQAIKDTLLRKDIHLKSNIFNKSNICELEIAFMYNEKTYSYEFKYDDLNREFVYEKISELHYDQSGKEMEKVIFIKDAINKKYECPEDEKLKSALEIISNDNIVIYILGTENFKILKNIKEMLIKIANSIEIVDMNNIPNKKTIDMLKLNNQMTKKIVDFIKNADVYLENYKYEENPKLDIEMDANQIEIKTLKNQDIIEQAKLVSVYKGKAVPSIQFDSIGTRKFAALASYIIESLEEGKTLFVDELDSSLHFKITRAIISMFNSDLNNNAQLIATLHDISLLDCKKMFRKEQIWFTDKNENNTKLYSLKEFNYADKGIRETTDIQDRYSKGAFGAIPNPDLISCLFEVNDTEEQ